MGDPFGREELFEVGRVSGLGPAFLARWGLGGGRRLGRRGPLGRRTVEAIVEVAESGFEFEHAGFEFPAARAIRIRFRGRGVHAAKMPESAEKRKRQSGTVNGYQMRSTSSSRTTGNQSLPRIGRSWTAFTMRPFEELAIDERRISRALPCRHRQDGKTAVRDHRQVVDAQEMVIDHRVDMRWADDMGISKVRVVLADGATQSLLDTPLENMPVDVGDIFTSSESPMRGNNVERWYGLRST